MLSYGSTSAWSAKEVFLPGMQAICCIEASVSRHRTCFSVHPTKDTSDTASKTLLKQLRGWAHQSRVTALSCELSERLQLAVYPAFSIQDPSGQPSAWRMR